MFEINVRKAFAVVIKHKHVSYDTKSFMKHQGKAQKYLNDFSFFLFHI